MIDKIIGAVLGFAVCKLLGLLDSGGGLSSLFHTTGPSTSPGGIPVSTHHPAYGTSPALPPGGLTVTSTAASFPVAVPAGLPPFPGGWKPARTTPDIVSRAQVLLHTLPTPGSAIELASDGRWIRYQKGKQGTKTMVTAWEPKQPVAASPTGPSVGPSIVPASYQSAPGALPPTLRKGMKGQPVKDLQNLLGIPADGSFGPNTEKAVKAFQSVHGLKPDGIAGPDFWRAAKQNYAAA